MTDFSKWVELPYLVQPFSRVNQRVKKHAEKNCREEAWHLGCRTMHDDTVVTVSVDKCRTTNTAVNLAGFMEEDVEADQGFVGGEEWSPPGEGPVEGLGPQSPERISPKHAISKEKFIFF